VQIIAAALADLKLDVWFDAKLHAGGSFDEEIAAALHEAKAVDLPLRKPEDRELFISGLRLAAGEAT